MLVGVQLLFYNSQGLRLRLVIPTEVIEIYQVVLLLLLSFQPSKVFTGAFKQVGVLAAHEFVFVSLWIG